MTARASALRYYVDESALGLGKVLERARTDTVHVGHPLIPECALGALDVDWMPAVAAAGLVAIGRDRHMRTRPAEVDLIVSSGLRVFRIGGKKDQPTWGWLTWLVKHWDEMDEIVRTRGPGPWWYVITQNAVTEHSLTR